MAGSSIMTPGEGPNSYAQNSKYQRSSVDVIKAIIEDEISTKLDINNLSVSSPNQFSIADFGSATGHNAFRIIDIITDAVEKKFKTSGKGSEIPDFQVFFNDQVMNDFNTLFSSLPPERRYYATAVAGPFHGRLFPKSSLHFAHSAWSLHWLSQVPKPVADPTSAAWNKGRTHYMGAPKEVFDAYSDQYDKDIDSFLNARAQELVDGGLMALLIPAVPEYWDPKTSFVIPSGICIMDSCLVEIAKEGKISETEVDSFNAPLYMPTPKELKAIIQKHDEHFSIEKMEILNNPGSSVGWRTPRAIASFYRSVSEGILSERFHTEIIDELFRRFEKKVEASSLFVAENDKTIIIFVVLRRK